MSYELTGKLIEKFETQQITDNFRKREFVIEKSEQAGDRVFTNTIKFQLTRDRCELLNDFETGDEIIINFDIRGNRWERDGRVSYFTNLEAWRVKKVETFADEDPGMPGTDEVPPPSPPPSSSGSDSEMDDIEDDLPF